MTPLHRMRLRQWTLVVLKSAYTLPWSLAALDIVLMKRGIKDSTGGAVIYVSWVELGQISTKRGASHCGLF